MTSLADAIIDQNQPLVHQLLKAGLNPNEIDEYGYTPLIETAIVNNIELGQLLLDYKADPNQKDMMGGCALHWTVENNNETFTQLLLNNKANPNAYNHASEPILVKPILRKQESLKHLLYQFGANTQFAWDYINLKLLGHRYDLRGEIDIVDTQNHFTELSFEGFFLEFSVPLIQFSLERYINHFTTKKMQENFPTIKSVINALKIASELIHYQQYQVDIKEHQETISALLKNPLLIIPVNYEGHAICFIFFNDVLIKCDRRKKNNLLNGITFYQIKNRNNLNSQLFKFLMYEIKDENFIELELPRLLALQLKARLLIEPQLTGNCSWANITAAIPAIFFLLINNVSEMQQEIFDASHPCLGIYRDWRDWDREYALSYCLQNFESSNLTRQASIASALSAVLFQRLEPYNKKDLELGKRIIKILKTPGLDYILKNYLEFYVNRKPNPLGNKLKIFLNYADSSL